MFKIIHKEQLAKDVISIIVEAKQVASKAKAGQFVVLVIDEKGERIPLTLADWDRDKGTITLIFQKVGFTTRKLAEMNVGDEIRHLLGPLGHPTEVNPSTTLPSLRSGLSKDTETKSKCGIDGERSRTIKDFGEIYCVGGGVGIAEVYPVSRAFKAAGNRVIGVLGARTKDLVILEDQMRSYCDELFITTDDGSYGKKGFVTDTLKDLFSVIEKSTHTKYPGLVYAIGPVPMMRAVCELTKTYGVKTTVSINPVMVDATGMCGSCRCTVDGKTVFGCVDGPDFDGHRIDFDELQKRLKLFAEEEEKIK